MVLLNFIIKKYAKELASSILIWQNFNFTSLFTLWQNENWIVKDTVVGYFESRTCPRVISNLALVPHRHLTYYRASHFRQVWSGSIADLGPHSVYNETFEKLPERSGTRVNS